MRMGQHQPTDDDQAAGACHDAAELARFGYRQQLARTMGGFSSFAVSFSLISILTGIFTNFGAGLAQVGPAVIWSWVVAVIGQLLVALMVAELAARFPLSGYGYQWATRLIGPRFGYFVGWLLLAQWLAGFPGICKTFAEQIHLALGAVLEAPPSVSWLTVGAITLVTLIHLWGIRLAALVNDFGVVAEIIGAAAITLVLLAIWLGSGTTKMSFLFKSTHLATGSPATWQAFGLSLLLGAWCITGFEAAADLAEETRKPRETVPRAVILSVLSSGIGGFLMLAAFILSIQNLTEIQKSDAPLVEVIHSQVGPTAMTALLVIVTVSIFACGVASMAAVTRLLFALARDNMLPASRILSQVHSKHQTPTYAILTIWLLTCVVVLLLEWQQALDIITSIATVAGYLGYGGIVLAGLVGLRHADWSPGFQLGRWRTLVGVVALVWTAVVVVALTIPNPAAPRPYAPLVATSAAIGVGALFYLVWIRQRIANGTAGPPPLANDELTEPAAVLAAPETV
jgi:amino acid transporter